MPLGFEEGFKNKDCTKILFFCPALVSRFTMLNFLNVLLCTEMLKFFHSIPFKLNYNDACFEERIKKDPGQPFLLSQEDCLTLSRRTLEKRSSKIRYCGTYRRKLARQPRRGTRIDASPCLRH